MDRNVLDEVRDRNPILEVAEGYTTLTRRGSSWSGLCPMPDHPEKTASFTVNPAKGLFHCFGCGAGGDVFKLVQQVEGVSFTQAADILTRRAGISVDTGSTKTGRAYAGTARSAGTASDAGIKVVPQTAAPGQPSAGPNETADVSSATPLGRNKEMTSISVVGNLAGEVKLQADKNGHPVAFADVIVTDRQRDAAGNWQDGESSTYNLTAFGSQAEQLRDMWERSGNARVMVSGDFTIAKNPGKDGQIYVDNKIAVDEIGVSLRGQSVTATRPDGTRIGAPRAADGPAMDATAANIGAQAIAGASMQAAAVPAQAAAAAPVMQAPVQAQAAGMGM